MKPEFNLINEPWIKISTKDYSVKEVSLSELFKNSHEYKDLAGESRSQDVAVLRFLISIVITVCSRYDAKGNAEPLTKENAVERYAEILKSGKFPEKVFENYFEKYRDRFYLFHDKYPFYQCTHAGEIKCTTYGAEKLNGVISSSNAHERPFLQRQGLEKETLSYAEAARWLIWIIAFDDIALKRASESAEGSATTGHAGRLGLDVLSSENNLFETIMFNTPFLKDGEEEWAENIPVWEKEPETAERRKIPQPDSLAGLLTVQTRRVFLLRNDGRVTGMRMYAGDSFDVENCFSEQMTVWEKKRKDETGTLVPSKWDSEKQGWRNFNTILSKGSGKRTPGNIAWIERLIDEGIIPEEKSISVRMTAVYYKPQQNAMIIDEYDDKFVFQDTLLTEKGRICQEVIAEEIERCEKRASYLWSFMIDIAKAQNLEVPEKSTKKGKFVSLDMASQIKEQFFFKIDFPFRSWMRSLSADMTEQELDAKRKEWNRTANNIAYDIADRTAEKANRNAFIGRTIENRHYSTPEALNDFHSKMHKLKLSD